MQPAGQPIKVKVHDFPDPTLGKAIPYGIYDLGRNHGWVSVGTDHDTGFAVATLRRWWANVGQAAYPTADRLLVIADAGGSNGYRVRAWKTQLARFATDTGLTVTVCHFPAGTSKWNKIEHRPFQRDLGQRALPAATQPRGDGRADRRDDHAHRSTGPGHTRPRHLPAGSQGERRRAGRRPDHPARLARRVELHHRPSRHPTSPLNRN
jgi:hypothetical protein